MVTDGDPVNPTTLITKQLLGAAITSSYEDEKAAVHMAPGWLLPPHETAAKRTDSQSLRKAIREMVAVFLLVNISDPKQPQNVLRVSTTEFPRPLLE